MITGELSNGQSGQCLPYEHDKRGLFSRLTCVARDGPCRQPADLQGYLRPFEHELNRTTFNVSTACAYGYRGKPTVSACTYPGGEYRLDGCRVAPSCSTVGTCAAAIASSGLRCDAIGVDCGPLAVGLAEAYTVNGTSDVRSLTR